MIRFSCLGMILIFLPNLSEFEGNMTGIVAREHAPLSPPKQNPHHNTGRSLSKACAMADYGQFPTASENDILDLVYLE